MFQGTDKDKRTGKKNKKHKTSLRENKKIKHLEEINGQKCFLFVSIFNKTNTLCKILNVRTVHRCMKSNLQEALVVFDAAVGIGSSDY